MNKITAYILNFDKDANAKRICNSIPCESYIVDSSGLEKGFIKTDYPFAVGCMNKSIEMFLKTDSTHCLFICSDVIGDWSSLVKRVEGLDEKIGIYTPSVSGQGWRHEKPFRLEKRDIPFAEGMICCYKRELVESIGLIECWNTHCYAVDIYYGFICEKLGLKCICDDSINMYHPFGSGYSNKEGEKLMRTYIKSKGLEFQIFCKELGVSLNYMDIIKKAVRKRLYKAK